MPYEPKLTPPSGLPSPSLLKEAIRPNSNRPDTNEISAPKSEATVAILDAIEQVRNEARDRDEKIDERFNTLDEKVTAQAKALSHLSAEVTQHRSQIGELSSAQVSVAKSVAVASELSAQAMTRVHASQDDNRKMIEGAMKIQEGVISDAVSKAIEPLAEREKLAVEEREKTNEAVGAIVDELGIEDQVQLGRDVKPGEAPPKRVLKVAARDSKASAWAATLGFVVVVVELAMKLLGH